MQKADWFFDFISPYAYFGLLRHEELVSQLDIRYRPVLFAGLLNHWEQKGPAEIPSKRIWTFRWCTWWAAQQGIPFKAPAAHPFNPLPYLRLSIAAGNQPLAVKKIFEAIWTTGVDPSDVQVLADLARSLGIDLAQLAAQEIKDSLRLATDQAIAQGVFGVPTLVIDQQLFWGADATDFAKAFVANPAVLASDEMRRADTLPVGASRR